MENLQKKNLEKHPEQNTIPKRQNQHKTTYCRNADMMKRKLMCCRDVVPGE
jgi:hypothetical protein